VSQPGRGVSAGQQTIVGRLSGKTIIVQDANATPMPSLAAPGIIHDGEPVEGFGIDASRGYPDVRSFRRKFGLLIPAMNTSTEHDWTVMTRSMNRPTTGGRVNRAPLTRAGSAG
jgi:hypothetical protein